MNFKQSTIFSIAASLGLIIFNMLINVIESRVLGPSEIGRYQIFITTQNLFATFCALGLGQSCIYFINALKVDERKVLSTTINATIPIASFASLVICNNNAQARLLWEGKCLVYYSILFGNKCFAFEQYLYTCPFGKNGCCKKPSSKIFNKSIYLYYSISCIIYLE